MMRVIASSLGFLALGAVSALAQGTISTQGFGYPAGGVSTRSAAGGGAFAEFDYVSSRNPSGVLGWGLAGHGLTVLLGEVAARHASSNAAAAARVLVRGQYAGLFWLSIIGGALLPLAMLLFGSITSEPAAAMLALLGLLGYEHAFVMAGQSVPIS